MFFFFFGIRERCFDRLLISGDGLSLIEPRTALDTNNGWSFWHAPRSIRSRGKVQKKERKKERTNERTNETFCSYPTTKRRRLGTSPQAASSAQLLHNYHNPTKPLTSTCALLFFLSLPPPPLPLYPPFLLRHEISLSRFFPLPPPPRLENPIIQTQRDSSSKLVETNPVFVADGHEVCRVVLLRELCKCRT